jgi:hypothetical protein
MVLLKAERSPMHRIVALENTFHHTQLANSYMKIRSTNIAEG